MGQKKEEILEKQRAANRRWYKANKDTLNKDRRAKYAEDSNYREKIIQGAKEYRGTNQRGGTEEIYRNIDGVRVRVFRLGAIGLSLEINPQTIRQWESKGYVPKATLEGAHRLYTEHQVALIGRIAESNVSKRAKKEDPNALVAFKEVIQYVNDNWNQ